MRVDARRCCADGAGVFASFPTSIVVRRSGPDLCWASIAAALVQGWLSRSMRRCAKRQFATSGSASKSTAVYLERVAPITLEAGDRVRAVTYVADRMHEQYAGRLDREAMLEYVRAGKGKSGDNARIYSRDQRSSASAGRAGSRPRMADHKTEILTGSRSGLRDRKICDGRRLFGRRRGQEMEMELKARAKGPEIALGLGDDGFGKGCQSRARK